MPADIWINARFLSRRVTGVERYGREILSRLDGECRLEQTRWNGPLGHLWEQFILPAKVREGSILWSPANMGPCIIRNQALTIHDLSPLEHREWFRWSFATWYRLFLPLLAKRVRTVFAPSQYVKKKIGARFGIQNVIVTPNGVDHCIFRPGARQLTYNLPERYILFVGTLEPRKNLSGLLRAWTHIKDDFQDVWLVIAGITGTVFRPAHTIEEMERVCFLGYVDEENLPGLYAGATLFVLPSFDEGFGLPALEAMACGTPVLASDGGALPEVIGDAGWIFPLAGAESLPALMNELLVDKTARAELSVKGPKRARAFSWQATADLVWKALNEI